MVEQVFSFPVRVYWEDTDAGGVVYHASYVRFLERGRTEWLRALGISQAELSRRDGILMAVREMNIDFLKPARLDDALRVTAVIDERRAASFLMSQELFRGAECLLRARVRIACLHASSFRVRALPEWLARNQSSGVTIS